MVCPRVQEGHHGVTKLSPATIPTTVMELWAFLTLYSKPPPNCKGFGEAVPLYFTSPARFGTQNADSFMRRTYPQVSTQTQEG